jgi:hypothetical protein
LSLRAVDFNFKKNFRASGNLSSFLSFLCEYFTAKKNSPKRIRNFYSTFAASICTSIQNFCKPKKKSSGSYQNELARF